MILKILKHIKRTPFRTVALLLFAVVITAIICALHASNEAELRNYEEAYQAIPITLTVTEPTMEDKSQDYGYFMLPWVLDLFTGKSFVEVIDVSSATSRNEKNAIAQNSEPTEISLAEYVK